MPGGEGVGGSRHWIGLLQYNPSTDRSVRLCLPVCLNLDGVLVLENGVDGESAGPPLQDIHDGEGVLPLVSPTLKKMKIKFFSCINKGIQTGTVAKPYMTYGLLMTKYLGSSSYIKKPFLILYLTFQPLPFEFRYI